MRLLYEQLGDIPVGFTEVEYLEATGTQYIDTGYIQNGIGLKADVVAEKTSSSTSEMAIIGRSSGGGFELYSYSNKIGLWNTIEANSISVNTSMTQNEKFHFIGEIKTGSLSLSINGSETTKTATTAEGTDPLTATIILFRHNGRYNFIGKMYRCRIWENDILIYDFIPCLDNNDVPCMYDKVGKKAYYNAGSGSFTCGPEKPNKKVRFLVDGYNRLPKGFTEVEYLESTGTQYIDTGVYRTDNGLITGDNLTSFSFKGVVEYTSMGVRRLMGDSGANNGFWGIAANNKFETGTTSTYTASANTKYKIDYFVTATDMTLVVNLMDGTEVVNFSRTATVLTKVTNATFDVFALGGSFINSGTRVYKYQVLINGNLLRDFIPCLDANNTPCMYDLVTKTAFYNAGTGNFTFGRKIIPIEYIQNTGTQYLDTGYDMANIRQIDMAVNWSAHTDTRREIMGSATSGGYSFEVSAAGYYGLGASNYSNVLAEKTDLLSWRYVVSERPQLYINGQLICTDTLIRVPIGTFKTAIADSWTTHSKIYWFKIYTNNGVMVRDYIAVRDGNNIGYMFDKVTHTLYGNVLSGTFVLGPDLKINTLRLVQDAIPTAYKRLNYIESSGAQYIDTGVIGVDGVLADINVMKTTATTNECFLGTWDSGSNRCWLAYAFSNKWYPGYDGSASDMVSVNQNAWANIKSYIETIGGNKYFGYNINGTNYTLANRYATFSGTNSIMMFAMNTNTGANYKATGRIGTCKITKDGVLVRDFIPVLRKSDNKAGMYDLITKQFYGNLGTGDFTYG